MDIAFACGKKSKKWLSAINEEAFIKQIYKAYIEVSGMRVINSIRSLANYK